MMINDFIQKIGIDKVLHFLVGALITSIVTIVISFQEPTITNYTMAVPLIGAIATFMIAVFKEISDTQFDWKDVLATVLGAIPIFLSTCFGVLLHNLSN